MRALWRIVQRQEVQAALLFALVACITLSRGWRRPNDWAEAHWLVSYEHGWVKRGFVGHLFRAFGLDAPPTLAENAITLLSSLILAALVLLLIALCVRVYRRAGGESWAVWWGVLALSAPFVVMQGHLNGYYDHLFMVGGIVVLMLLLQRRYGGAILLQMGLVLIHESYLLVGYPMVGLLIVLLAWRDGPRVGQAFALLTPPILFLAILGWQDLSGGSQGLQRLYQALVRHLDQYPFLERGRPHLVAESLTTPFTYYLQTQSPFFLTRLSDASYLLIVTPLLFSGATLLRHAYRLAWWHLSLMALVVLAPLSMHLIAWDTSRIWLYPHFHALVLVWLCAEFFPRRRWHQPPITLFALTLLIQVAGFVPLMDFERDRLSDGRYVILLIALVGLAWLSRRRAQG